MAAKAASLDGIDWNRIREASVEAAMEIEELGRLMETGTDSDIEFGRLCELLIKYGETDKATALLIANVDEGEDNFKRFQSMLAKPEAAYRAGVASFENQFSSKLKPVRKARFLSVVYQCDPPTRFGEEVQITYDADGQMLADAYDPSSSHAVSLRLSGGVWLEA
ncbi:hypothetical protein [Blastopirellula marina]|uniref:Uncharacterized protein n=1 Tax=Blastopirellula marina TaxID=124 RepID=A0A2S8GQZ3_9BACT|nr:hypothetical protein [Blastopirellula marina]PQO46845.1 hypothetical protein C5Y93_06760 [Blastopirellula marina]